MIMWQRLSEIWKKMSCTYKFEYDENNWFLPTYLFIFIEWMHWVSYQCTEFTIAGITKYFPIIDLSQLILCWIACFVLGEYSGLSNVGLRLSVNKIFFENVDQKLTAMPRLISFNSLSKPFW